MRVWLNDAWSLIALAFGQVFLTMVFMTFVPYLYLSQRAASDPEVAKNMEQIAQFAEANAGQEVSWNEVMEAQGSAIRELLEALPCAWLIVAASVMIYPFLGWWAGRWLTRPELGGLLILGSVSTSQNIIMVPRNVEYMNVAPISLGLPVVLALIVFQFVLLTLGIMRQRGQGRPLRMEIGK